jgi:hypothetical protein
VNADIVPDADGTRDIGTAASRFGQGHFDELYIGPTQLAADTLTDPGADRLLFWDDSASSSAWLELGTGLSITGTTINVATANTTTQGIVELATTAETTTGTATNRAVTPGALRDATHTGLVLAGPLATYAENAQTGTTYTLALADHGRGVTMANASAQTLTIPANATVAFGIGAMIPVVSKGAGALTITAASGVTLNGVSAGSGEVATPASGEHTGVSLWKVGTNAWYVIGNIGAVT